MGGGCAVPGSAAGWYSVGATWPNLAKYNSWPNNLLGLATAPWLAWLPHLGWLGSNLRPNDSNLRPNDSNLRPNVTTFGPSFTTFGPSFTTLGQEYHS